MTDFFRFPQTPHIAWLAQGAPRDDKVLSPSETSEILASKVVLEEKLDGANLGFSVSPSGTLRAQNRGQYLERPYQGQFGRLEQWLSLHEEKLFDALDTHLIAFGEWCAAKHSLDYAALPDWWLLFDIYDCETGRFWSVRRRDAWAVQNGFVTVPELYSGKSEVKELIQLVQTTRSRFRAGPLEGIVIRKENTDWLEQRAKLVRADFTQAIDSHWRSRSLEWNRVTA